LVLAFLAIPIARSVKLRDLDTLLPLTFFKAIDYGAVPVLFSDLDPDNAF